ncbi:PREDICTED: legumin B-like [Nicotiana attenuata]|uniref:11s globulin subunit beta n=1 Tax=Nicotiana attenuata TaxID=49451 RepID=A0A314LE35_NICAT|nr:PREDICTED: legumin B-like [Nicotiana attenuata]OIT39918.1 11s globulin subunit beta [Nicotiana attenuata]
MATFSSALSLTLCFLVLSHCCFAQLLEQQQQNVWQRLQQQQQHRALRSKTECQIERLNAQEPTRRFESEAGVIEFWDATQEQFECAGVQAVRHQIRRNGLLLPYYTNTPMLMYIIQGRGIHSTVIPGCAETYETESGETRSGERRRSFNDRHQKLRRFRAGDVLALPAGVTFWMYNDAEEPIVTVSLLDTSNHANQLDLTFRSFFLAGNPQRGVKQQFVGRQQETTMQERRSEQETTPKGGNIFNGFDTEILSEAFNVDVETIRKLQGQNEERGVIVRAEELRLNLPEESEQEERREQQQREGGRWPLNGLEETVCTMKLRENIGHPSRSDVYNPRGGRVSTVNSLTLPILNFLQLSAERGTLYRNAILAPHWNMNAHSIIYIIRGSGRIQVVGNAGRSVFDDEVRENQLLIVPQNFAIVKRAGNEGLDYIAFKTNDNAMVNPLAGRLSALRAMPEEVLMNSYQISRQEARSLKYNREELTVFGPGARSSRREEYA